MKSSHRFPLRRQIVWGMRFFTILTSLAVGAALFTLSNQYVRANSLQAAEFNLRLVATSIETSLDSAVSPVGPFSIKTLHFRQALIIKSQKFCVTIC